MRAQRAWATRLESTWMLPIVKMIRAALSRPVCVAWTRATTKIAPAHACGTSGSSEGFVQLRNCHTVYVAVSVVDAYSIDTVLGMQTHAVRACDIRAFLFFLSFKEAFLSACALRFF